MALLLCRDLGWYELAVLWSYPLAGLSMVFSTWVSLRTWVVASFQPRGIFALLTDIYHHCYLLFCVLANFTPLFHVQLCSAFLRRAPRLVLHFVLRVQLDPFDPR